MSKQAESSSVNAPTKEETQPGLGILEDDDEFEEFVAQGSFCAIIMCKLYPSSRIMY
jgi:hypothetical protein